MDVFRDVDGWTGLSLAFGRWTGVDRAGDIRLEQQRLMAEYEYTWTHKAIGEIVRPSRM